MWSHEKPPVSQPYAARQGPHGLSPGTRHPLPKPPRSFLGSTRPSPASCCPPPQAPSPLSGSRGHCRQGAGTPLCKSPSAGRARTAGICPQADRRAHGGHALEGVRVSAPNPGPQTCSQSTCSPSLHPPPRGREAGDPDKREETCSRMQAPTLSLRAALSPSPSPEEQRDGDRRSARRGLRAEAGGLRRDSSHPRAREGSGETLPVLQQPGSSQPWGTCAP